MKKGVLLVNLGSPDSPEPKDVRKYLDLINQSFISLEDNFNESTSLHSLIPDPFLYTEVL